jgi:hypothetical protein
LNGGRFINRKMYLSWGKSRSEQLSPWRNSTLFTTEMTLERDLKK